MTSTSPQPKMSFDQLLALLLTHPLPQLLVPCVSLSSGSSCGRGDTLLSLHCTERGWQGSAPGGSAGCEMPAHIFGLLSASCTVSWAFPLARLPCALREMER